MPNRLAGESSPYLLQHKDNPVDWYPWGEEAFERAKSENKPVFLSVGYSSCHWCHVMEHESFENDAVAAMLNESYISVKVDREERPDVDEAYMTAVQLSSGRGGWPMSVFLTPDKKPFFAGTYFPREDRGQHPGFLTLCRQISLLWNTKRAEVESNADEFALGLSEAMGRRAPSTFAKFDEAFLADAIKALAADFDNDHGGFGKAPKFPPHTSIDLLIRYAVRPTAPEDLREIAIGMAFGTLHQMAVGGIHDHVGGGFHRYSTDEFWLLPHFEKMLYDNALMIGNYALASAMLRGVDEHLSSFFGVTAMETAEWVHRELTSPDGSFFSALDADSEGEEGKFYVWELGEIREILSGVCSPERTEAFIRAFGLREEGNFEDESTGQLTGENILQRLESDDEADFGAELDLLMEAREKRPRPGLDDKVLVSWNGLMIRGLADAGLLDMAAAAAEVILRAEAEHGHLPHQIVKGAPSGRGFLDDYAAFADGLFSLVARLSLSDEGAVQGGTHAAEAFLEPAKRLTKEMIDRFWDEVGGGFFGTSEKHEQLFGRTKPAFDSPTPSANALALRCLMATGDLERANRLISAFLGWMEQAPQATEALFAAGLTLSAEGQLVNPTPKAATPSAPVEVVVRLEPKEIRAEANGIGHGELVFSVPEGLHLNSNNPPARWLIATVAAFQPVKAAVTYPSGDTYEGDFRIPFTLELPSGSSGEEFEVRVTYQACTDSECLLPDEKVLSGVLIRS